VDIKLFVQPAVFCRTAVHRQSATSSQAVPVSAVVLIFIIASPRDLIISSLLKQKSRVNKGNKSLLRRRG
jgi:hypothetical protein